MANDAPEQPNVFREPLRLAVQKLPRQVKLRAQNSFFGFDRARQLLDIDREMAAFRAITAEEEAAAALFRSLQLRRYPGAEKLSFKLHQHKAALGPFLQAVKHSLANEQGLKLNITLLGAQPSLSVSLPLSQFNVPGGEKLHLTLEKPLDVVSHSEGIAPEDFFERSLKVVAGTQTVNKLIEREANARNLLLYASDSGLPQSKTTMATIDLRQRRAEMVLLLCIAVLQVKEKQPMATQCLAAFLKLVGRTKKEPLSPGTGPDKKGL